MTPPFSPRNRIGLPPPPPPPESRRPDGLDPLAFRLDWWAYWEAFKREHGQPVDLGGVVAFPDGWTHARADPRGPEWPPPADPAELLVLLVRYWVARLRNVEAELRRLREAAEAVRGLQARKSAPLQGVWRVRDEATGRVVAQRRAVSAAEIEAGRVAWLAADAEDCRAKLRELLGGAVE